MYQSIILHYYLLCNIIYYHIYFYTQGAQKGREKIVEASSTQACCVLASSTPQNKQKSLNEHESKNY